MIPLHDQNPAKGFPFVTIGLIIACAWVFFAVQPNNDDLPFTTTPQEQREDISFSVQHAAIPCEVLRSAPLTEGEFVATFQRGTTTNCSQDPTGPPVDPQKNVYLAMLFSMFMHGGWVHLLGNMLFLWVFGNNIESRLGHFRYLGFYLLGGLLATLGHIVVQPFSAVPLIGASGAVAAVMGAYLVLYPKARVSTFVFIVIVPMPAAVFLLFWFVAQFQISPNSGVAWVAHVVGFVFGAVVAIWVRKHIPEKREVVGGPPTLREA